MYKQITTKLMTKKKDIQNQGNLDLAKIRARERINSMPSEEAQKIVNEVIYADMWEPDTSKTIDWDDSIPIPKSWTTDEAQKDS